MNNEKQIFNIALQRLNDNIKRNVKFAELDRMKHVIWASTWPSDVPKPSWWKDSPSAMPANDLSAATRMYSSVLPVVKMEPIQDAEAARAHCNDVEDALVWQYNLAAKRGDGVFTYGAVESMMLYGMGAVQIVYLPAQRKIASQLGTRAIWNVQGDYAFLLYHPSSIYDQRSELYGLQNVLSVKDMYGEDIIASWGDKKAAKIVKILKDDEGNASHRLFRVYDWTDDKHRVVLAQDLGGSKVVQTSQSAQASVRPGSGDAITIENAEHGLPFLSWSIKRVGSPLETLPEYQVTSLFNSMYEADQWNELNIWRSMIRSSTAATMLAPQTTSNTMDGESPETDFSQLGGNVPLQPNEHYSRLPPSQLDPRILEIISDQTSEIGEGTLPRILVDPKFVRGAAFASQNQMIQSAENSLLRFTHKAEDLHADLFKVMLMWKIHTGDNLEGYAQETTHSGAKKSATKGRYISITSGTIPRRMADISDVASEYAIYLKVELKNALPIDEVQKLNGGNIMRNLGMADELVYESLGYNNPQKMVEARYRQQFVEAAMSKGLKKLQAMAEAEAQKILNAVALEQQKAIMEMQKEAQQPAPPPQGPPPGAQPPDPSQAAGSMPPDVAGGPMSQAVPNQLNPDQMRQQAMAKAMGGSDAPNNDLAAIVAAAKGGNFSPNQGGAPMATLAPGALTKEAVTGRDRKGHTIKRGK